MNKTIISFLTACFVLISSISAIGFSTHSTTISRSFDKEEAVAGETIRVTVSLTNLEVNELRGFYYTEQMPAWLAVDQSLLAIAPSGLLRARTMEKSSRCWMRTARYSTGFLVCC